MVALASAFIRLRPQPDKREFRTAGEEMGAEAGKGASESFGSEFTRGADGKLRDSRGEFVKDSETMGEKAGDGAGRKFSTSFAKATGKGGGKDSSTFGKALGLISAKATIVGLASAAATPGVLQLTAALVPAAGVAAGLPAALGAAGVAMGTFKVATAGVSDAIGKGFTGNAKQAQKALDSLPPAARNAAKSVIALKPAIDRLRASVSERFFRPIVDDVTPLARKLLPLLRTEMSRLAGPLGGIGEQFLQTARKTKVLNTIPVLFNNTRVSVIYLRQAIQPLTFALAAVIKATAKALPRLSAGFVDLAKKISAFIQNASASGAVYRVFQDGITTVKQLAGILINVASILHSVFAAATSQGSSLLANLQSLTGEVAAFLKSAQGSAALTSLFGTLATFGQALRTSLGAVLPAIAQSLQILGPALAAVAGPAAQLVVALAPLLPIFTGIAVTTIERLTPAIATLSGLLARHAGVVKALAGVVVAFLAVQKLTNLAIGVQAAGGVLAYLKTIKLVTVATRIWAGVQAAFNIVMDANPIALAVIAIAALVAGIVYAYKHSETFRNIVLAVWGAIKTAIKATVDWITGVAWPAIVKAWQAIAAAGLWLWHNVIEPVWHGIQAVIGFVVGVVKAYIAVIVAEFRVVAAVAMWLWHNIFEPVFNGIIKMLEIFRLAAEIVLKAVANVIQFVVGRAVNWLRGVWDAVFTFVADKVRYWWQVTQVIFQLFRTYVLGPLVAALHAVAAWFARIFAAIGGYISSWWRSNVAPVFASVRAAWNAVAGWFSSVYNTKIKPLFEAFVGFVRKTVVGGFKAGVDAITSAWAKVQEAARKPVAFVVNHVINPFINGLNRAAAVVGVKDRVEPIKGFRGGGKISGSGGMTDNRQAWIPGQGAVQLQGGEFVVNRQDTAKALPLLRWVNAGMSGGAANIRHWLGRPVADMPGDGSEGWAFKGGGLIGWADDVWNAVTHPLDTIKKPFDAALRQIPGLGMIKNFVTGSARSLADGAIDWVKRIAGGGKVGEAVSFLHRQDGKPYIWADAGPDGYDCSGIVSAVWNILHNRSPYNHTFSTESAGAFFPKAGQNGQMAAAWSHPGQAPASATVGHMMGRVGNLNFESSGSRGVHLGSTTRRLSDFANIGHYADGGLLGRPIQLFDQGGMWRSGTLGANLSGHTEYVDPTGRGGSRTYVINQNIQVGVHPAEVGRQTVKAIQAFENANGTGWRA